jgi:methionyl-tRNA formyltransferase/acetyltransferase-like isoleucine patch superfamily enzyme
MTASGTKPKRIFFLGSKPVGYQSLVFLNENRKELNIEIAGILTNNNPVFGSHYNLSLYAAAHGIKIFPSLEAILSEDPVDFIISIQYHQILKPAHIAKATELALNLHMAPLPEYRGCNQFSFAILDEAKEFGTTIHRLESGIDSGAIIAEKRFPIPDNCFVKELYDLTEKASIELFKEQIGNILRGEYTFTPQQELLAQRGTSIHFRREIADIKILQPEWPKEKIFRYIRATYMPGFEPPYALIDGQKHHVVLDSDNTWVFETEPNKPILRSTGIRNVTFGKNVLIYEPVNLYECEIGDDCFIGPYVEVQRGVHVGRKTKIQSHAFLCELVTIGDECFISHGAMFINDTFSGGGPAQGNRELWKSTRIGNRVMIGTNATILPVTICDDVVVGAGSVVTKDITEPGIYAGNPARKLRS